METRASVDWQRVADLFDAAVEMSGSERTAWLDAQCADESTLRREVEELLHAHDDETHALDRGVAEITLLLAAESLEPAPDQWVGGRYRLRREIGRGGMGIVYEAHDARSGRDVALKFLPPGTAGDPQALERLRIEARATSALAHPNLCAVRRLEQAEDGRHFLVLTLYRGLHLAHLLRTGPLPPDEAASLVLQAARGLGAAHRAQVVHRDIKPSNLLITSGGEVKILDFGVAKLLDHATMTRPGDLLGTPRYMAPEQIAGERVDGRADLFSLGALFYEMIAGRGPFEGSTPGALVDAVLFSEPRPLPEIPATLERMILRLLAKNPEERYADASALVADLVRYDPPLPSDCRVVRARVLRGLGSRLRHFGESFAARRHHERALGLWRDLDDRAEEARETIYLGRVDLELHELESAQTRGGEGLERLHALDDRRGLANAMDLLGRVALLRGELDEACRRLQESVAISSEIDDGYGAGTVLCHLAWAEQLRGAPARCDALLAEAGQMARGPHRAELRLRIRLIEGLAAFERGESARACDLLDDVAVEMHGVGRRAGAAIARIALGAASTLRGQFGVADDALRTGLELSRSLHAPWTIAVAQEWCGRLVTARNGRAHGSAADGARAARERAARERAAHERAEHLWRESLRLRAAIGDMIGIASTLEGLADEALIRDDVERATRLAAGAAALRERTGAVVPPRARGEDERRRVELRLRTKASERPLDTASPLTLEAVRDDAPGRGGPIDALIAYALRS